MSIKDYGSGDPQMFKADDLERWYKRPEGEENAPRIQGRLLNELFGVTTYETDAMYTVTPDGVEKL